MGAKFSSDSVYERIERLIMDHPSGFDVSGFTERDLFYIRIAMTKIAMINISRILSNDPLKDLDMSRVFEEQFIERRKC